MNRIRRGYSLVEMLVAIVLISTTMSLVAFCLHTMYRAGDRLNQESFDQQALQRFALQLRTDAHQATSAEIVKADGSPEVLKMNYSDGKTIEYSLEKKGIKRVARQEKAVTHRDDFTLPPAVDLAIDSTRDVPLISLQISQRPVRPHPSNRSQNPTLIRAAVGIANHSRKKD